MLEKIILILGLAFILITSPLWLPRIAEQITSPTGCFTQYPHSGFTPDSH